MSERLNASKLFTHRQTKRDYRLIIDYKDLKPHVQFSRKYVRSLTDFSFPSLYIACCEVPDEDCACSICGEDQDTQSLTARRGT